MPCQGINNVTMISDACFFCGVPEGKYSFNGRDMFVEGGFAKLENGTICGSACSLAVGAKNMFDIGYKPEEMFWKRDRGCKAARFVGM